MSEELAVRLVTGAVMLGAGAMLWWMARAAAAGRLGRNAYVGIRIPSTMASDEAWLAGHRRAERPTVAAAGCSVVAGLVALLVGSIEVAAVAVLVGSVAVLGFVTYGAVAGGRAARAAGAGPGPGGP